MTIGVGAVGVDDVARFVGIAERFVGDVEGSVGAVVGGCAVDFVCGVVAGDLVNGALRAGIDLRFVVCASDADESARKGIKRTALTEDFIQELIGFG